MTAPLKQTVAQFAVPSFLQLADQAAAGAKPLQMHFDCAPTDMACITMIVKRANEIGSACEPKVAFETMLAMMDIAAVHCNCVPLKLEQFLMSDNVDFMRDFGGIGLHVDRSSGQLLHGWRPMFARVPA